MSMPVYSLINENASFPVYAIQPPFLIAVIAAGRLSRITSYNVCYTKLLRYSSIFFRDYLNKKDKYSAFLGTNQPVISIKTNAENNNKLLVIKDSYANCYAPFLIQHYSEITLIDMRYINKSLDELVDLNSFSQVLFLYNSANYSVDHNIKKLNIIK